MTRLAEQGFNIQLNEAATITHPKGFNAALRQRDGLYFLSITLVNISHNMTLEINQTAEGTTASIAPVTFTSTGMEIIRNRNDLWTFNSQGFLVRIPRTEHKALFVPDDKCPIPTDRLENYRHTIIQRADKNNEDFEEAYQDLNKHQQRRVLKGATWTGETWFKVKRGTPLPGNTPPPPPLPATAATNKPTRSTPVQDIPSIPATPPLVRHTTKGPVAQEPLAGATHIPHPKDVSLTSDYWVKEGQYWKRVHVQPRHDLYIPQHTSNGPDVNKLLPER